MERRWMLCTLVASACQPSFGAPQSLVDSARLLAVRGNSPEAALGASVLLTPLVAAPGGTIAAPVLDSPVNVIAFTSGWRVKNSPADPDPKP